MKKTSAKSKAASHARKKPNKPSTAAKNPPASKKERSTTLQTRPSLKTKPKKSQQDNKIQVNELVESWPTKTLPLRNIQTEFSELSDDQKEQNFAKLLKGLFRVVIAEKPSAILLRNDRRFQTREVFKFAVEHMLFGKFNADNSGNIFYINNNKKEFDEALKGFLRKVGQSMDECFQVHDYEGFKVRLNKTLYNIRGVRLSLAESPANSLKLCWEKLEVIELPAAHGDRLEEVKLKETPSNTNMISMTLPRWSSKARESFEEANRLIGPNNPLHLKKKRHEIESRLDSRDDVKIHLPSKKTALLDFQISLAKLIPRKVSHGRRKKKLPTADTIEQRKAILLDFLKSTLDYELFWTARSANSQPELLGDNYLNNESYPNPENLLEVWEIDGMPFCVFSALQKKLPAWWFKKKAGILRENASSKPTTKRVSRSAKRPSKRL
jgi:hypothetical protein